MHGTRRIRFDSDLKFKMIHISQPRLKIINKFYRNSNKVKNCCRLGPVLSLETVPPTAFKAIAFLFAFMLVSNFDNLNARHYLRCHITYALIMKIWYK